MLPPEKSFLRKDPHAFCEGCSDLGLYDPTLDGCIVCRGKNVAEIASTKFEGKALKQHPHLGFYDYNIEAISKSYQERSSAGGFSTALIHALLELGIVDYALTVSFDSECQEFVYKKFTDPADLVQQQRSAYFPVKLSPALDIIRQEGGSCVITGIPAAIKAVEQLKLADPDFARKVKFTVGLVSGGIKIESYTDYMCKKAGKRDGLSNLEYLSYRDKPDTGPYTGSNYIFRAQTSDTTFEVHSGTMPMNWPGGLLKSFASDFCDDTFNVSADVAVMDAWRPRFRETRGVSLAIIRDGRLRDVVLNSADLHVKEMDEKELCLSQVGGLRHKTIGLKARVNMYRLFGNKIHLPLVLPAASAHPLVYLEQFLRLRSSYVSRAVYKKDGSFEKVERRVEPYFVMLRYVNKLTHRYVWKKQQLV